MSVLGGMRHLCSYSFYGDIQRFTTTILATYEYFPQVDNTFKLVHFVPLSSTSNNRVRSISRDCIFHIYMIGKYTHSEKYVLRKHKNKECHV